MTVVVRLDCDRGRLRIRLKGICSAGQFGASALTLGKLSFRRRSLLPVCTSMQLCRVVVSCLASFCLHDCILAASYSFKSLHVIASRVTIVIFGVAAFVIHGR